jgi:hypothetical protein
MIKPWFEPFMRELSSFLTYDVQPDHRIKLPLPVHSDKKH